MFADRVFPAIDEEIFSVLYSDKASRPNTPVNVIVGALILKEVLGDTDDELVQALMFDVRYQYALHTTSFEEQPLSDRTLSRFRARCLAYETETEIDLIHVPGVVFQSKGYRIGYGGGYYDRYLEDFTGKTVSTIYSIQQKDFQPDTFDQAVQEVLVYEVTL